MSGIDIKTIKPISVKIESENSGMFQSLINILGKDIKLFGNNLKDKKKQTFYNDLETLLSSGIDLKTTLELICDEVPKKEDKQLFQQIMIDILDGSSLSDSLEKTNRFTSYEVYSIRIGEESGRLLEVLKELSGYYTGKIEQKKKLTSAFSYPLLVMATAFAAVVFMLNFIVPMFMDVFKRFGNAELPVLTTAVMKASQLFSRYFWLMLIVIVLASVFIYISRKKVWFRKITSTIALKIPFFGEIIRKSYLARFCFSMKLLVSAHVPLINAIRLQKKIIEFYPLEISFEQLESDILKGKSLHESLSKFKIYDKRMISLIKVAEEVNQLDKSFERLQKQYSDDVSYRSGIIGSVLEPVMIIFIGVFVAVILIAMYLPMFQLSSSFAK